MAAKSPIAGPGDVNDALAADLSRMRHVTFVIQGRPGPHNRPALPPGDSVTWGAITTGIVLNGATYPYPVFS